MKKFVLSPTDAQSVNVAYLATVLAHNPHLERFLKHAQQLQQDYRDGRLCVPADIDLSTMDEETAAAAAALILFVRG